MKFPDKKHDDLHHFLQRHRPRPPETPSEEADLIWARIVSAELRGKLRGQWRILVGFGFCFCLVFLSKSWLERSVSEIHNPRALSETEALLIQESLNLEFMEAEDTNEVFELASWVE